MRLNGKAAILRYLGKSPSNRWGWTWVVNRYADAIRTVNLHGDYHRGYWARSEDLDAVDLTAPTLRQMGARQLEHGTADISAVYRKARAKGVLKRTPPDGHAASQAAFPALAPAPNATASEQ